MADPYERRPSGHVVYYDGAAGHLVWQPVESYVETRTGLMARPGHWLGVGEPRPVDETYPGAVKALNQRGEVTDG